MLTLFRPGFRASFYHRACIPQALRPYFKGKRQVWQSLRTTDPEHARVLTLVRQASTQKLFLTLKREGPLMSPAEIERLIAEWKDAEVERLEDVRVQHRFDEDQRSLMVDLAIEEHEALDDTLEDNHYARVTGEADALLKAAGLPLLDHDSLNFKRLCRRFLLAKREVLREEIDRWQGLYKPQPVGRSTIAPIPTQKPSPLFSEVMEKYLRDDPKGNRTAPQVRAEFLRFIAVMKGDRPIATITKQEHTAPYVDYLRTTRENTLATVAKHVNTLSGLFSFAIRQGYIEEGKNPCSKLAPDKAIQAKEAQTRRPFTTAELVQVFGSPSFRTQRETRPDRYWVPLICLFQLCRRDEAAQLQVKDIGERDGIPSLMITDQGEGQSLKNEGSKRTMPLHSSLIELGFLEYVASMKDAGQTQLFPLLQPSVNGWGDGLSKWFRRHLNGLRITDKALVFHSLRHGIFNLHRRGCPQDVAEMLTGHSPQGVHNAVYAHRDLTPLRRLKEGLECLQYPEVVTALKKG